MDFVVQIFGYFNTNSRQITQCDAKSWSIQTKEEILNKRKNLIGSKCQMFYKDDPFVVSYASMQYIYDHLGCKYIDCNSNVQHVGHCHPLVVDAIAKQTAESSCNIRFVSSKLTECAEKLLSTLPGLDTVLFCNSGSEANDLALRLARDFTRNQDAIVIDHAYHGHLISTMEMSPYKFNHNGSTIAKPQWVHVAPCPDVFRGKYQLDDRLLNDKQAIIEYGKKYSNDVFNIIQEAHKNGRRIAAFFSEALQSCGGQIIPPPEYFCDVARYVRNSGGLVVMDEVQTGFGRTGSTFWAHQLYDDGFIPDIVTMGKPMGNGYPVSAVVTRKEIADALGGSVEYFNTYGGNPVACAAVIAVMEVMKTDNLLEHSQRMGEIFKMELSKLKTKHQCIGDIRGVGMFWGIDIVKDRTTREPDHSLAMELVMKLRRETGILINADGPYSNILKIKPPLCFSEQDLYTTVNAIDINLHRLENKEWPQQLSTN